MLALVAFLVGLAACTKGLVNSHPTQVYRAIPKRVPQAVVDKVVDTFGIGYVYARLLGDKKGTTEVFDSFRMDEGLWEDSKVVVQGTKDDSIPGYIFDFSKIPDKAWIQSATIEATTTSGALTGFVYDLTDYSGSLTTRLLKLSSKQIEEMVEGKIDNGKVTITLEYKILAENPQFRPVMKIESGDLHWFFWIDYYPNAMFAHDTKFVFVRESDNEIVKVYDGISIPVIINSESSGVEYINDQDMVYGGVNWLQPVEDVPRLIRALQARDLKSWLEATLTLTYIGQPAVEPLIAALKDKDSRIRNGAAAVLGMIKDTRAVQPLLDALKTDEEPDVRRACALSLGEINDESVVESLMLLLNDKEPSVQKNAAYALGILKPSVVIDFLIAFTKPRISEVASV
jgi:hypothetical protein